MFENQCQLCFKLGGLYSYTSTTKTSDLVKHSEMHRSMTGDKSEGAGKKFFGKCFPHVSLPKNCDSDGKRKKIALKKRLSKKFKMGQNKAMSTFNKNESIEGYCRVVVVGCPTDHIRCSICKKELQTRYPNGIRRIDIVLNHVLTHAKTAMFTCRYCDDYRAFAPTTIKSHLSQRHKLPLRKDHYVDETRKHRGEILKIIDQCFGSDLDGTVKYLSVKSVAKVNPKVIRRPKPKPQRKKANLHCQQLLRRFGKDGKIKCHLCSPEKLVFCRQNRSTNYDAQTAIDHAAIHLKKLVYFCKLCTKSVTGFRSMVIHINHRHGTSAINNYVDHSEKYEADVIRILSKCYDKDWEKRVKENQKSRMGLDTKKEESTDEVASAKKCQEEEDVPVVENENGPNSDSNGRNENGQDENKNIQEELGDIFCKCKYCLFSRSGKN